MHFSARHRRLVADWTTVPKMLESGLATGYVKLAGDGPVDPRYWVALKGRSVMSDAFPPEAYGNPGWAGVYNKWIWQLRRRIAGTAFWTRTSLAMVEAQLETHGLLLDAIARNSANPDAL